jgi:DNA-binding MltR family transcriptional regulator
MKGWRPLKLEELSIDTQKVFDILNEESDLACVLIGTSYLSELLASTLKVAFIESSISERILDPQRGAVGGFATRADLAYSLGLISKSVYQDLIKVAEIRNLFAHKHLALDFGEDTIRKACGELQAWRFFLIDEEEELTAKASQEQMHLQARNQFNISVVLVGSRIHIDALSKRQVKKRIA